MPVKVVYWPQRFSRGYHFFLRSTEYQVPSTENAGGRGNPFSAIGANAFRTTMRGAEFHSNTRRDGQPAYPV